MFNDSYNKITENLYVGDVKSPRLILQRKEITHVISLVPLDKTLKKMLVKKNIKHFEYPFGDNRDENIIRHFNKMKPTLKKFLFQDKGRLLIHCMVGRSRSVGITILILMKFYNVPYKVAYDMISSEREIGMNPGFERMIKECK